MQLKTAFLGRFFWRLAKPPASLGLISREDSPGRVPGGRSGDGSGSGQGDGSCSRVHVYGCHRSAAVTFQQHDGVPWPIRWYPKDQRSGQRHCRYDRPGHLHHLLNLSSPPHPLEMDLLSID